MISESPFREFLGSSDSLPPEARACIPGYTLPRVSCAVWKLALEEELVSDGLRAGIDVRCRGILF